MKLQGLHVLLTYRCNVECDHCFVWGSPRQTSTFTIRRLDDLLAQARAIPSCRWVYFEGGEPFLYYPLLRHGVETAADMGFKVGLVTNAYWATTLWDAVEWLQPLSGLVHDLAVSNDLYHGDNGTARWAHHAERAALEMGIPSGVISIAPPDSDDAVPVRGRLPEGESQVMFRGRAAETLAPGRPKLGWESFTVCPYENLAEPGRVHVGPSGWVEVCQGISIGNAFETPLRTICESYRVEAHPVAGPIHAGGPAEFARRTGFHPEPGYADACHLCYASRKAARAAFPSVLAPDTMYGVGEN